MHVSKASYKACYKVHAILRRSQIYIVEIKKPTISERQKHINILNPKIIMEIAAVNNYVHVTDSQGFQDKRNWRSRRLLEAREINIWRNSLSRHDGIHLPHDYFSLELQDKT